MSGKTPRLNPLELRKQLLLAESDLNRERLGQEWAAMTGEIHSLANQAKTIGSIASATACLVAGIASFSRKKSAPAAKKHSWWQTALNGAGLISNLWQTFRPLDRDTPEI